MDSDSNAINSSISEESDKVAKRVPAWLKVSAIAAASGLAGGLAAAWFYRKALTRLQNAGSEPADSNFGRQEWYWTEDD